MKPAACIFAGVLLAGCCHVNRLAEQPEPIGQFEFGLGDDPIASLQFTRKMKRQTKPFIGAMARVNRQVLQYEQLLAELSGGRLREHLHQQLPRVLERQLGWRRGGEGVRLELVIEELAFSAEDHLSPLALTWRLTASLRRAADSALLWRSCDEWSQGFGSLSIEQLEQSGLELREQLLDRLAIGLGEELARRLAADGAGGER